VFEHNSKTKGRLTYNKRPPNYKLKLLADPTSVTDISLVKGPASYAKLKIDVLMLIKENKL
jgi:hypothetical protein